MLLLLVDSTGAVVDVEIEDITTPGKGFEAAAETAVRRWRYDPGELGGRPVNVWVEQQLEFQIEAASER
jgi:TonB family protein